jgi:hypothetical protein
MLNLLWSNDLPLSILFKCCASMSAMLLTKRYSVGNVEQLTLVEAEHASRTCSNHLSPFRIPDTMQTNEKLYETSTTDMDNPSFTLPYSPILNFLARGSISSPYPRFYSPGRLQGAHPSSSGCPIAHQGRFFTPLTPLPSKGEEIEPLATPLTLTLTLA